MTSIYSPVTFVLPSVTPGGLVVIVTRLENLQTTADYKDKLEPHMDELEKKGSWRKVRRDTIK